MRKFRTPWLETAGGSLLTSTKQQVHYVETGNHKSAAKDVLKGMAA